MAACIAVTVRRLSHADEMHRWVAALAARGSVQKRRVTFHGIKPGDDADKNVIVGEAPLCPDVPTTGLVGPIAPAVDSVGDND